MIYAQTRIRPGKWDAQIFIGFWDINGLPDPGHTARLSNNQQKIENL